MQNAVGGLFRLWLRAAALSGVLATPMWAQGGTGKLEGLVQDDQGRPLVGAQVYLVGSAFGGVTDPRGRYFINNVPAGLWTARAAFLGHRPLEVRGLRVLDGQTVTRDFALEATALELQTIEVLVASDELVPRDEVTTKQRIDGQFADALPVDRINTLLSLQPGVVDVGESYMSGGGRDTEGGLSIRGGRPSQNAVYIDGVPVQPGYYGSRLHGWIDMGSTGTALTLGTNAIQQASVTSGAPSAEFGNATAGIVSLVTGIGGPDYRGSLALETDEVFGVNHGPGFNRVEAGLSGPLAPNLTFSLTGLLEGHRSVEEGFGSQQVPVFVPVGIDTTVRQVSHLDDDPGTLVDERLVSDTSLVPVYRYAISRGRCDHFAHAGAVGLGGPDSAAVRGIRENYGFECNGVRLPVTPRTLYSLSGRLTQTYGAGSRLSLTVSQSRFHGHRFNFIIPHVARLTAGFSRGFSNRSRLGTLNWVHNLSRSAERALALDVSLSYQEDRTISGPLTASSRAATRDAFGGMILEPLRFLYDFESFPLDDRLIANIRRNVGRVTPRQPGNTSYDVPLDVRNNPYALYGEFGGFFSTMDGFFWRFPDIAGVVGDSPVNLYREKRHVAKAGLDWQADRYNRLKLGGDLTRYAISHYASRLRDRDVGEAYIERPIRWSAYIEDRLDLGDVIVVGGLRYDWYHTRAARPYAQDTAGNRYLFPRISSLPGVDLADPTAHFVRDRSHGYLSPHVQVAFPVTARTNFRLSYAHQVQAPDFGLVLSGINGDLGVTSDRKAYGADLDFGKTISLEFGIRQSFGDDMVVDVAAYHRSIVSDPAVRLVSLYDPALGRAVDLRLLTNLDFGAVKGIDLRLDRRFGRVFNGTIGYAYQDARSTGSDPFTYINFGARIVNEIGGVNGVQPPPQAILPTDYSRPHTLTGAFSLTVPGDWKRGSPLGAIFGDVSVFSTFRYTSGTAYTPCGPGFEDQSVMSSEFCIRDLPAGLNSRRLPAYKEINARVTKSVAIGGLDLTAYADIRNLLNFRNVIQVFAVNGSTRNDVERQANLESDLLQLAVERDLNAAVAVDGESLRLPAAREQCAGWMSSKLRPAAANCIYLIRAEQRYGDGDGIFTIAEQTAASNALYDVARGEHEHTAAGRRARLGMEIAF